MTHWRQYMDDELLRAYDLPHDNYVVEIESVSGGEVTASGGKKGRRPIIRFKGHKKYLVGNVTNCRTIATITGTNNVEEWVGHRVTLFIIPGGATQPGTGEVVDAVRIRPTAPKAELKAAK